MAIKRLSQGRLLDVQASGDNIRLASGATVQFLTGSKQVPNSGTQAASIPNVTLTATYANDTLASQTQINAIIGAIRGVGIIA